MSRIYSIYATKEVKEEMRVCSFHPSEEAAEEFAGGLRKRGAEGVEVGQETSAGYPVFSVVPDEMGEEIKVRQKSHVPESSEEYKYETTAIPVLQEEAVFEIEGKKFQKSRRDIIRIAREELWKANLGSVRVRVSRYQGKDPEAVYADATWFKRGKRYSINIHPIHQYYDEEYTRNVARHEIEHILRRKGR